MLGSNIMRIVKGTFNHFTKLQAITSLMKVLILCELNREGLSNYFEVHCDMVKLFHPKPIFSRSVESSKA